MYASLAMARASGGTGLFEALSAGLLLQPAVTIKAAKRVAWDRTCSFGTNIGALFPQPGIAPRGGLERIAPERPGSCEDCGCLVAIGGSLLRGDDTAYGHALGKGAGALEVHGVGGHVGVLEACASVEEDDLV